MFVIAAFEYSSNVELALTDLEQNGVQKECIFAIPLQKRAIHKKTIEIIYGNHCSAMDMAFIGGTMFAVLGAVYGFVWRWGPIIWGWLGFGIGAVLGSMVYIGIHRSMQKPKRREQEIFVMVQCDEAAGEMVEEVLWNHFALGIAKVYR